MFVAPAAVAAAGMVAGTARGWQWRRVSVTGGWLDPVSIFVTEFPPGVALDPDATGERTPGSAAQVHVDGEARR
jgi:hypothetical protein